MVVASLVKNDSLGNEIDELHKVGVERKAKKQSLRLLKEKNKRLKLQVNVSIKEETDNVRDISVCHCCCCIQWA